MSESSTLIGYSGRTIGREELALVPTPPATETHRIKKWETPKHRCCVNIHQSNRSRILLRRPPGADIRRMM